MRTYFEATSVKDPDVGSTYLLVIPSKTYLIHLFLPMQFALASVSMGDDPNNSNRSKARQMLVEQESRRKFAEKLHVYTHFTVSAIETIFERECVLNESLKKVLQKSFDDYTTCNKTGRSISIRKVSINYILSSLNDFVQIYLFFMESTKDPILYIIGVHSGYS